MNAGGRHAGDRSREGDALRRDPWGDDDDLDATFGPDTASVRTRTGGERLRAGTLVVVGVVVVAAVLVLVLGVILGQVQRGVGGVFPQPDADGRRFVTAAAALPGVAAVDAPRTEKTSFAGYDVTAAVHAEPDLPATDRRALVTALSTASADSSGSGVRIWATLDLGAVRVGVSDSPETSQRRLELADGLAAIGGVLTVTCVFADATDGRSDAPAAQDVVVTTHGQGVGFAAVAAAAEAVGDDVFPGVQVRTRHP
ncbi:hypothetical protein [Curtobacterium sp. MCBD17_023]|uniref:hypothetical protein n=1 Tax=Curtobacterium sp. MCBD17_023 TaxID=2175657 RepID=UPI000D8B29B5|nr:hypothetical protein [Curtobacterium sp. MCBD17_023]PYY51057.1 hypothetical protein DEI84_04675 [Curtobacterium sp. MCBD17_023]